MADIEAPADSARAADLAPGVLATVKAVAKELRPSLGDVAVTLDTSLDRDLGIDSLGRAELVARIEQTFAVALPDTVFAAAESPRDLLQAVLAASGRAPAVPPQGEAEAPLGTAEAAPATAATLVDVLAWHEARHPDRPHVRLYADEGPGEVVTYGELAAGARRIAAALQAHDVAPGETVAIMLPTGRDYFCCFFGVLLAGAVAVPMYPPARMSRVEEHVDRHIGILGNCQARLLVAAPEIKPFARLLLARLEHLRAVVTPEDLATAAAGSLLAPSASADRLAFLQYTSGSTGDPKGVMLTHANVLANIRAMGRAVDVGTDDVFVSWLPLYHDMGLIAAWLGSFNFATPLVIMPPLHFLARPRRWLAAVSRYRGTLSGGPNFAYELCLRRIVDTELDGLDLASWRVAFNGAEPVHPGTLERFCLRFAAAGFRRQAVTPVYGLAENCVGLAFPLLDRGAVVDAVRRDAFQTSGRAEPAAGDEPSLRFVACGRPLLGHQIRIVDAAGRELPERREGRVQFRGPSATQGYFRRPEASRALFAGDWLDTGDLGYVAGGEIYVTGRSKDLIIRAGRNIHPSDLEAAVGALEGIVAGNVAAFGSEDPDTGTERLVLVAETRRRDAAALDELRARINALVADSVGEPADDVVLAPPGTVPRTSSGKIRRAACRALYEAGEAGKARTALWLQVLRLHLAAVLPQARRLALAVSATLYGAYAWTVIGLLAAPLWIATVLSPSPRWRWRVAAAGVRVAARIGGVRLSVQGLESVPGPDRPCVFVANHMSYLDGFVLAALLPRPVAFVAKQELKRNPLVRLPLERLGAAFVERFDSRESLKDHRRITAEAAHGISPLFFAEGTFRRMPGLLPFHMGAFAASVDAGIPIVPVAIRGTRNVLRANSWLPRRGAVSVHVAQPVVPEPSGDRWRRAVRLRDQVRAEILRLSGEPDLEQERVEW